MKILSAFVAIFLLGITAALAGTGKQSYSLPGELPAGSSVWLSEYVEAVGEGAAIASTFRVPPPNPANFYVGITHVNFDGTLNTTMAPDGVFIHPSKTNMYAFDSAFDKLALAGTWGPNGNPSYMQTFSALEPEFDSPAIGLGGTLRFAAVSHDEVNSRFLLLTSVLSPVTIVVTDENGQLDASFNGTGTLNTGLTTGLYPNAVHVAALSDGSIVVAVPQSSYWLGNTLHLRRYSATGALLASASPLIGHTFVKDMAIDSQDRIVLAGIFSTVTPTSSHQATVLRYTSSLQADASFGTAGKATYSFLSAPGATSCPTGGSGTGCNVGGVAIQADDKIVVGGYRNAFTALAVARVNVDGTLDTTFGSSGVEHLMISGSTLYDNGSIDLDEDDGIWITGGAYQAGNSNRKTLLVRLTPDGALNTSFGSTP